MKDISSGSSSIRDVNFQLDKDSLSLLNEASAIMIWPSQNISDGSEKADAEKSSGAWKKIQDLISS